MDSREPDLAVSLLEGSPMKWAGALLAAWVLALAGCVIPQDDTLFAGQSQPPNRPPRIVENQVSPQTRIIREFGSDTCRLAFELLVTDPDVNDRIGVSWYVDYAPGRAPVWTSSLTPTNSPLRDDRATFDVDLSAAASPLSAPGLHLVEAVVADRQLDFSTRLPFPDLMDNPDGGPRLVSDEGYAVTYAWVVETVAGVCP
jgi:hypothetical protein